MQNEKFTGFNTRLREVEKMNEHLKMNGFDSRNDGFSDNNRAGANSNYLSA